MTIDRVSRTFITDHPRDAARVFERFRPAEVAGYLEGAAPEILAPVFLYMSPTAVALSLPELDAKQAADTLRLLGVDRAAILLRRMPHAGQLQLINAMPTLFAGMLRLVLRFPEGTVGQLMNPNVATINVHTRIDNTIGMLRNMSSGLHNEVFVVDDSQKLAGIVEVKDLITVDEGLAAGKIMHRPRHTLPARTGVGSARALAGREYHDIYPVVDHKGQFVGILRHEILLEATDGNNDGTSAQNELASGFLAMADLFWNEFLNLFIPDERSKDKREEK